MTRPEEVLALPLTHKECDCFTADETFYPRITANGSDAHTWTDTATALVTMCNAYPLALALAEVCEGMLAVLRPLTQEQETALQAALDAFLAHRQEATK